MHWVFKCTWQIRNSSHFRTTYRNSFLLLWHNFHTRKYSINKFLFLNVSAHIYQLILQFVYSYILLIFTYLFVSSHKNYTSFFAKTTSLQKRALPPYANKFKKHSIHCSYKHDSSLFLPVHFPSFIFIFNLRRNSTWVTDIVAVVTDMVAAVVVMEVSLY